MEGFECLVVTALWVPPLIIHYTRIVNLFFFCLYLLFAFLSSSKNELFHGNWKSPRDDRCSRFWNIYATFPPLLRPIVLGELFRVTFFFFLSSPFSFFFFSLPPLLPLHESDLRSLSIFDFEGCWFGRKIWVKIFKNFERYACCITRKIFRACTNISIGLFNIISPCEDILNRFWTYWLNFQAKVQESQDCYLPKYNINSISFTLHLVSGLYILNDIKTRKGVFIEYIKKIS